VIVLSDGFCANSIEHGVRACKVHAVRDSACPSDCLMLYARTYGISRLVTSEVEAAARLAADAIRFAFVGEGADKQRLRPRIAGSGLNNATLRSAVPHEQVPALLAAADICLVPLREVPLFRAFIPSKTSEYLASCKDINRAVTGEAGQILQDPGALVVPPAESEALATAIQAPAVDPRRQLATGRQGRCYVERHFDRDTLARLYRKLLDTHGGER
jgi:glycosyltransferase involved in cell wall biosynthesis